MINLPTVLVLGAGASMPFGFPSGQTLVDIICNRFCSGRVFGSDWMPDWLSPPVAHALEMLEGAFSMESVFSFANHLDGEESIDAFLEHQTGEFVDIGKMAIAAILICFEREQALFHDFTERRLEAAFKGTMSTVGATENWYQLLWRSLEAAHFENFEENRLKIITFNYDRSLEHYLFTRLKRRFPGKEDKEYATKVCPITHVHGRLGYLPWQLEAEKREVLSVPYDAIASVIELRREVSTPHDNLRIQIETERWFDLARKMITVIHEGSEDTHELKQAREWIGECQQLYFLGFGYHPSNIERLKIESLPEKKYMKGTIQGLSLERKRAVTRLLGNAGLFTPALDFLVDTDNYDFLHDHVDLTEGS